MPPGFKVKTDAQYGRNDELYDITATSGINVEEHADCLGPKLTYFA